MKTCRVCGRSRGEIVCRRCGRIVCRNCYTSHGLCIECRRELVRVEKSAIRG